jgi:hypothetical protein
MLRPTPTDEARANTHTAHAAVSAIRHLLETAVAKAVAHDDVDNAAIGAVERARLDSGSEL